MSIKVRDLLKQQLKACGVQDSEEITKILEGQGSEKLDFELPDFIANPITTHLIPKHHAAKDIDVRKTLRAEFLTAAEKDLESVAEAAGFSIKELFPAGLQGTFQEKSSLLLEKIVSATAEKHKKTGGDPGDHAKVVAELHQKLKAANDMAEAMKVQHAQQLEGFHIQAAIDQEIGKIPFQKELASAADGLREVARKTILSKGTFRIVDGSIKIFDPKDEKVELHENHVPVTLEKLVQAACEPYAAKSGGGSHIPDPKGGNGQQKERPQTIFPRG